MKHTPGPWAATNSPGNASEGIEPCLLILTANRSTLAEVFAVGDTRDEQTPQANARLIAAAPSLLEALRAVVAALSQPVQSTDLSEADLRRLHSAVLILRGDARFAVETATAAIAKATA